MRIILCVTSDINTDRRVIRIASTLTGMPANVLVIGRKDRICKTPDEYNFRVLRMRLIFNKGPLFYAEYNTRLFLLLLIKSADLLVANDLDTLPAVYLASKIRRKPLVYDSHEYYTEVPELIGRKVVRKIWEGIEKLILPHIKHAYTVSAPIAADYNYKYGINMHVVRNLPNRMNSNMLPSLNLRTSDEKIIIYQGSLNMGRGLESAIRAMQYLTNTRLIIIGTGDVEGELKELANALSLEHCVSFPGRIMPDQLMQYTVQADMGISLEEMLGLSYFYALPNKLFDYIQARIPVLVSNMPEMANLVKQHEIGMVTLTNNPLELSMIMGEMLNNNEKRALWKSNLEIAARQYCWENEEEKLIELYQNALTQKR